MRGLILFTLLISTPLNAGVTDGQRVNAATTNAAFMDKNTSTTFTTAIADIQGGIETKVANDTTTTGSLQNATLSAPITIFSNTSLTSIQNLTIANRADGTYATIRNNTTGTLTLKNLSGGTSTNQINTATGSDLAVPNGGVVNLYYDTVNSKWQVVSLLGSDVPTPATVTNGGTGRATLTNHGVLVGAGTSAITQLATGTSGQALLSGGSGADPAYTTSTYPLTSSAGTMLASGSANTITATATPTLGVNSTTNGSVGIASTSGGSAIIQNIGAASNYNFNLPTTAGSAGSVLISQGGGSTSMTWGATLSNPATAAYDTLYQNASNTGLTNLANGTTGQVHMATTSAAPSWVTVPGNSTVLKAPTTQIFTSTGSQTGWLFTVSTWSGTLAVGDTYTNNAHTFTVQYAQTNGTGQTLFMSGSGSVTGSTLTKSVSASGPATMTFSAELATATYTTPSSPTPLYLEIEMVGGGGGGAGSGGSGEGAGSAGALSVFGNSYGLVGGGAGGPNSGTNGAGGTSSVATSGTVLLLSSVVGGSCTGAVGGTTNFEGISGAVTPFGGAGAGGAAGSAGSTAAVNSGSGGGGGGGGSAVLLGGGGCAGGYAKLIITSPAASFPYVVGALGAHGGGGTGGSVGGDGGAGRINVKEVYQ